MSLVFFISGHGFGHASRDVEVLNAFGRLRPDVRLIIRSAVSPRLLRRTLTVNYELRPGACDTGIVQATSVSQDDAATVREATAFYETFDDRIATETQALAGDGVRLIVGDIAPLAFEVADRLGVPSIALGNFTWDWIYEQHPGFLEEGAAILPALRRAYGLATRAMALPFSAGFEVFPRIEHTPLVARLPTYSRADARATLGLPLDRPIALLSFGGYGLASLDLRTLDCLDRWTVLTTDQSTSSTTGAPAHVRFIREDDLTGSGVRYEDMVAAADVVVTKPGYGIISECIAGGTGMLYTSRGQFREYDVLVREIPRYLRCRFISQADLFAGRWLDALEEVRSMPSPPERLEPTGASWIARALSEYF